jgi:hypothetical protein
MLYLFSAGGEAEFPVGPSRLPKLKHPDRQDDVRCPWFFVASKHFEERQRFGQANGRVLAFTQFE